VAKAVEKIIRTTDSEYNSGTYFTLQPIEGKLRQLRFSVQDLSPCFLFGRRIP
jgi:hypothetical protein